MSVASCWYSPSIPILHQYTQSTLTSVLAIFCSIFSLCSGSLSAYFLSQLSLFFRCEKFILISSHSSSINFSQPTFTFFFDLFLLLSLHSSSSIMALASSLAALSLATVADSSAVETKTVVFKPKTAKTAVPVPVLLFALQSTETPSNVLAKAAAVKEPRVAKEDLVVEFFKVSPKAVSYTHLDVYKRQHYLCGLCYSFQEPSWRLLSLERAKSSWIMSCFGIMIERIPEE